MLRICIAILLATFLSSCDSCTNSIKQQINSPDDQKKIVIFSRDCGATTGFNIQISVLDINSELPNKTGNTFIGDNVGSVDASWSGPTQIQIKYDSNIRIFKKEASVNGTSVLYSLKKPNKALQLTPSRHAFTFTNAPAFFPRSVQPQRALGVAELGVR